MIALKKEVFDLLKKEGVYFLYLFLAVLLAFKIAFFNDSFVVVVRGALAVFWIFVIPGYFGMLFWHEKLDFVQRTIIGTALAAGLAGTISYYFGLAGLDIKYHTALLPPLIIILGLLLLAKKKE